MRHILFGDSIGFGVGDFEKGGWATQLRLHIDQSQKKKDHNLINLSVSGDTTRDLLNRLEPETKVRIRPGETKDSYTLLLMIGTNDARIDKTNLSRNITVEEYKSNLVKLIAIGKQYYSRIVLIGLPPVDETRTTPFKEQNFYLNENIAHYEGAMKTVANESGCDFIEMFSVWKNLDIQKFSFDGLHPNTTGHEIIYQQILTSHFT